MSSGCTGGLCAKAALPQMLATRNICSLVSMLPNTLMPVAGRCSTESDDAEVHFLPFQHRPSSGCSIRPIEADELIKSGSGFQNGRSLCRQLASIDAGGASSLNGHQVHGCVPHCVDR